MKMYFYIISIVGVLSFVKASEQGGCINQYSSVFRSEHSWYPAVYNPVKSHYQVGEVVGFHCIIENIYRQVVCTNSGWSAEWLQCNGKTFMAKTCFKPRKAKFIVVNKRLNYQLTKGTKIEYYCEDGYYLYGVKDNICTNDHVWENPQPECIEPDVYKNRCILSGKKYHVHYISSKEIRLSCIKEADKVAQTELNTITTITSTAAGIFGILLLIVIVVSFQRRRILHRIRREELENAGNVNMDIYDEQWLTQFSLPSYDEATRTKPTSNPPSFEEAILTPQNIPPGAEESTLNSDDSNTGVLTNNHSQTHMSNLNIEEDMFVSYPHHGSSYDAPPPYTGGNNIRPGSSSSLSPLLDDSY